MKKSLYSLILMDSVVKEVDLLAKEQNTNRSNLINQILAEYVSLTTPEKKINNIFNSISEILNGNIFSPYIEQNDRTMSLKSSLQYKYRPTIKYNVELYRTSDEAIGELKVVFRTQSTELLIELNRFFNIWVNLERTYLSHYFNKEIEYSMEAGRFFRTIRIPIGREYTNEVVANAISSYIKMFDEILKGYLSRKYNSYQDIENRYLEYLNNGIEII